jgi:basic membrane protein A
MNTDVGGLGDKGFNDAAYKGLKEAHKKLGVKIQVVQSSTPTDYQSNLSQLAGSGYSPVYAIGFLQSDALGQVAPQYPKTKFAIVDSVVKAPNVASLVFKDNQGAYLAGVVAGDMTQQKTSYTDPSNKVVGFIGGQSSPLIRSFQAGYDAGVKSVCPDCKVINQYVGSTPDAFNDPATAKQIALNQINQGADIVYPAAGNSASGAFQAAEEKHVFAIGVDQDQAPQFPKAPILTSTVKGVDNAVFQTVRDAVNGKFPAGKTIEFGLSNGGYKLAPFHRFSNMVPQKVKKDVQKARQGIISGKIKVPTKPSQVK